MPGQVARVVGSGLLAVGLFGAAMAAARLQAEPQDPGIQSPQEPTMSAALDDDVLQRGRLLFLAKGCNGCHNLRGLPRTPEIGPDGERTVPSSSGRG